jgi:hypothetical protein
MFHLSIREERADRHVLTRSLLTPAVPVLIVGLQDADKTGHAGSITVFGRNRSLSIGRGLARLPNPREEIGDFFHGGLSAGAVDTNYWSGNAPLDQEKGRRALRRRPCPATAGSRGVGAVRQNQVQVHFSRMRRLTRSRAAIRRARRPSPRAWARSANRRDVRL